MNYAGFWLRISANMLDYLIFLPIVLFQMTIVSISKEFAIISHAMSVILFYSITIIFLVKFGATPGKLIMRIKVTKMNGDNIGVREAFLRDCIGLILSLFTTYCFAYAIIHVDFAKYQDLKMLARGKVLMSFYPAWFKTLNTITTLWVYSEFLILLTNEKRRAIHDFIAGTVVIDTRPKKPKTIPDVSYKELEKSMKKIKI